MSRRGFGLFSGVESVPPDIRSRTDAMTRPAPNQQRKLSSGAAVPERPTPVVFPPYFLPPPEADNFAGTGSASIVGTGVGLVNWTIPASLVIRIPVSSVGIISSWVVYVNNMATTTQAIFQLRINGAPIDGYGRYTLFPRAAASVGEVVFASPVFVWVPQGAIVDVMVSIGDAATYQCGATVTGWAYPQRLADAYAQLLGG